MDDPRIRRRAARLAYLLDLARRREAFMFTEPQGLELTDEEREDVYLANALLEAACEIDIRRWAALEALLPLIPPGGDESDTVHLPRHQAIRAAVHARVCGWFWFVDG